MTGEIVEFPGREPPPEGYSEQYIDKLHSEAFRDLEVYLHDCVRMSSIAIQFMTNTKCEDDDGRLSFAVLHLDEMLRDLWKRYNERWHGERRGTS
jgi:hypothetical protein